MSNDPTSRRPATKSGNTGAPMGSTISIIVAAVAVVVGFLILKNIKDDSGGSVKPVAPVTNTGSSTSTSGVTQTTPVVVPSAPTTTPIVTTGAIVIVANASGVNGAAGRFTDSLGKFGFATGKATNAVNGEAKLTVSKVYFIADPVAEAVARSVAQAMGGIAFEPVPTPVNIKEANMGDAGVLVMLGSDKAEKPLDALATATTVAGSVAAAPLVTPAATTG
jgi:hypothetical protein